MGFSFKDFNILRIFISSTVKLCAFFLSFQRMKIKPTKMSFSCKMTWDSWNSSSWKMDSYQIKLFKQWKVTHVVSFLPFLNVKWKKWHVSPYLKFCHWISSYSMVNCYYCIIEKWRGWRGVECVALFFLFFLIVLYEKKNVKLSFYSFKIVGLN